MLVQLIRHARTAGNERRQYIGLTDEPLSPHGKAELKAITKRGVYTSAKIVFTSPLRRCRETAALIFEKAPLKLAPELAECDFGEFEGKSYEELRENALYREWIASEGSSDIPGGESREHFKKRCCDGFQSVLYEIHSQNVHSAAIVVHGGSIMAIMERFSPDHASFYDWQVPNCGGIRLLIDKNPMQKGFRILQAEKISISAPPKRLDSALDSPV